MLYEKMLTAVEETSTFGLEWDAQHYKGLATTRDDPVQNAGFPFIY